MGKLIIRGCVNHRIYAWMNQEMVSSGKYMASSDMPSIEFYGFIIEKRLNHRNGRDAMKDDKDCWLVNQKMVSLVSGQKEI